MPTRALKPQQSVFERASSRRKSRNSTTPSSSASRSSTTRSDATSAHCEFSTNTKTCWWSPTTLVNRFVIYTYSVHVYLNVFPKSVCTEVYPVHVSSADAIKWQRVQVNLPSRTLIFVLEALHGGSSSSEDEGDICVDDLRIVEGECGTYIVHGHDYNRQFIKPFVYL